MWTFPSKVPDEAPTWFSIYSDSTPSEILLSISVLAHELFIFVTYSTIATVGLPDSFLINLALVPNGCMKLPLIYIDLNDCDLPSDDFWARLKASLWG